MKMNMEPIGFVNNDVQGKKILPGERISKRSG